MARITVEDCLDHVPNRFELVLLAAKRARELLNGAEPKIKIKEDKYTVIALREIAEGLVRYQGKAELAAAIFDQVEADQGTTVEQELSAALSE